MKDEGASKQDAVILRLLVCHSLGVIRDLHDDIKQAYAKQPQAAAMEVGTFFDSIWPSISHLSSRLPWKSLTQSRTLFFYPLKSIGIVLPAPLPSPCLRLASSADTTIASLMANRQPTARLQLVSFAV